MRITLLISIVAISMSATAFAGPLGDAAKKGDVAEIERLLASGVSANEEDPMASPLHWAALNGHIAAARLLVDNGASLEAQSSMLGTPLHAASRFGRDDLVRTLLEAGADPDLRGRDGITPLMRAVVDNQPAVVEALLFGGANVDAVAYVRGGGMGYGPTIALQLAIKRGRGEIADILRAAGAGAIPQDVPAQLLENGDPEQGREAAYAICQGCHTIAAEDPPQTKTIDAGPPLIGVIGRQVADFPDYEYSEVLKTHGGAWTPERFYAFTFSPTLSVPGTRMNWVHERTPEMIADITAYFVSVAE
jgi:cytochrome c